MTPYKVVPKKKSKRDLARITQRVIDKDGARIAAGYIQKVLDYTFNEVPAVKHGNNVEAYYGLGARLLTVPKTKVTVLVRYNDVNHTVDIVSYYYPSPPNLPVM